MSGVGWDYAGWYERGLHPRSAYIPPEDYDDRKYDTKELAIRSRRLTSRWPRVALYTFIPLAFQSKIPDAEGSFLVGPIKILALS